MKPRQAELPAGESAKPSRSLFHYTTAAGLIGILESGNLHATHYEFLNDETEGDLILDVLAPRLEGDLKQLTPKLVKRGILKPEILDLGDSVYKDEAANMLSAMKSTTNKISPYFITSFCMHTPDSREHENGLLSQWRAYARGGFSIEFDEIALDKLNVSENERYKYAGIVTNRVSYRDYDKEISDELFGGFARAILRKIFPDNVKAVDEVLGTKSTDDFARPFLGKAAILKNQSFEEENEYRIVALCQLPGMTDPQDKREFKEILFKSRSNGGIVPYIELYSDISERLPIKSIIVGPHPHQEEQKIALKILLKKKGYDVPVRLSNIPFRD